MKIDGAGSLRNAPLRRSARRSAGEGADVFARALAEEQAPTATPPARQVGPVGSLLALQEVEDSLSAPERATARAEELLDRLDDIRHALLTGVLRGDQLQALAQAVASRRAEVSDPRLAEILDEIDLRAQVELAKLDLLP